MSAQSVAPEPKKSSQTAKSRSVSSFKTCLFIMLGMALFIGLLLLSQPNTPIIANDLDEHPLPKGATNPKVLTPDWSIGALLTDMGHPPIGIGDKRIYNIWVNKPKLPAQMIDIGQRYLPNPELIATLNPDIIIDNDFYQINRSMYDPNVPLYSINYRYAETKDFDKPLLWQFYVDESLKLSNWIDETPNMHKYLQQSKQSMRMAGDKIKRKIGNNKKIAVVQFADTRTVNLFGENSTVRLANKMMGLDFTTLGTSNQWGVATVSIDKLMQLPKDTCLIVMQPLNPFLKKQLTKSRIWQRIPFSKPGSCMYVIDSVWTFGGVESLVSFANKLEDVVVNGANKELLNDLTMVNHKGGA